MKKMYLLKLCYFDVNLQKNNVKTQLKICEPSEIKFVAKDYVIWFRSLPGVRHVKLDVLEITETETIIKGLGI